MKNKSRKRTLSFEMLESKCAPATMMLLVLAPMDDAFHSQVEQARENGTMQDVCPATETSKNWQFQFSTNDLLKFVDDNTTASASVSEDSHPSVEKCRSADEMMKASDHDLRACIIADSLHVG